ncbi:MAG: LysM peptidoglycan-binding domain-containing protein [Planctomycetaceae bacterium]|nr:LysM peptidoglycan-binding domain-containing protein [Planctomycetaceae bacterium]
MSSSHSGTKLFVAFVALGAAILTARPFRRDVSEKVRPVSQVAEHVVLRETPGPDDVEITCPDAPTAEIQRTLLAPPPVHEEPRRPEDPAVRLAPPSAMAKAYPDFSGSNGDPAYLAAAFRGLGSQLVMERVHAVRDGDTLEGLAQRYLGDRSRWREIYQVNRDRIQQPELLPLGTKLVIPPKGSGMPVSGPREKSVIQTPLVPLAP